MASLAQSLYDFASRVGRDMAEVVSTMSASVSTRTALAALDTARGSATLTEAGREGIFSWVPGNLSAFVSADTTQGMYVAPTGQNGSTGAWVRSVNDHLDAEWFGRNIQAAINVAALIATKAVFLRGLYSITTAVAMRPYVKLYAHPGTATVRKAAGSTAFQVVEFSTHTAHNATVEGIIFDGNRGVLADNLGHAVIASAGAIEGITIRNCEIINGTGHGILLLENRRAVISGNTVHNCCVSGIYVKGQTITALTNALIEKNRVSKFGQHGIVTWNQQGSRVLYNNCVGFAQSTRANITGDIVTINSGADFTNVSAGEFVIGIHSGGYFEALIIEKQSNLRLKLQAPIGTYTNVPCVIGNGDVISISGSRDELIQGNTVNGGACLGISLFATSDSSMDRSKVIGNTVASTMASGYSLQVAAGGNFVRDNLFMGNYAIDTGIGGPAMDAEYRTGMTVGAGSSGLRNVITDNTWISYGSGTEHGLRISATTGGVRVGSNKSVGVSPLITNGAAVTLAGWGSSTATVECMGDKLTVTVNTSGATASPSITITHYALPLGRKAPVCTMVSTPNTVLPVITYYPEAEDTSTFVVIGTPSNGTNRFIIDL